MSIKKEKKTQVNKDINFNNELFKQTGMNIIHQNLTKEELISCAYGYHKAKSENKTILLAASILLNLIFFSLFLCAISTAFKLLN